MNKSKKIIVIVVVISIILLVAGGVCLFLVSLSKDKENLQARMSVVTDTFDKFNEVVSAYELDRDNLYSGTLEFLYYDTIASTDAALKTRLKQYESNVDNVIKERKKLDKLCDDVYYPDSSINSKCSDYKLIYEQVINYFMEDVKLYNNTVLGYNDMVKAAGGTELLVQYKTDKEYVDYNKDGAFEGKSEEDRTLDIKDKKEENTTSIDDDNKGNE